MPKFNKIQGRIVVHKEVLTFENQEEWLSDLSGEFDSKRLVLADCKLDSIALRGLLAQLATGFEHFEFIDTQIFGKESEKSNSISFLLSELVFLLEKAQQPLIIKVVDSKRQDEIDTLIWPPLLAALITNHAKLQLNLQDHAEDSVCLELSFETTAWKKERQDHNLLIRREMPVFPSNLEDMASHDLDQLNQKNLASSNLVFDCLLAAVNNINLYGFSLELDVYLNAFDHLLYHYDAKNKLGLCKVWLVYDNDYEKPINHLMRGQERLIAERVTHFLSELPSVNSFNLFCCNERLLRAKLFPKLFSSTPYQKLYSLELSADFTAEVKEELLKTLPSCPNLQTLGLIGLRLNSEDMLLLAGILVSIKKLELELDIRQIELELDIKKLERKLGIKKAGQGASIKSLKEELEQRKSKRTLMKKHLEHVYIIGSEIDNQGIKELACVLSEFKRKWQIFVNDLGRKCQMALHDLKRQLQDDSKVSWQKPISEKYSNSSQTFSILRCLELLNFEENVRADSKDLTTIKEILGLSQIIHDFNSSDYESSTSLQKRLSKKLDFPSVLGKIRKSPPNSERGGLHTTEKEQGRGMTSRCPEEKTLQGSQLTRVLSFPGRKRSSSNFFISSDKIEHVAPNDSGDTSTIGGDFEKKSINNNGLKRSKSAREKGKTGDRLDSAPIAGKTDSLGSSSSSSTILSSKGLSSSFSKMGLDSSSSKAEDEKPKAGKRGALDRLTPRILLKRFSRSYSSSQTKLDLASSKNEDLKP